MRKNIVTGSTGFIGYALCQELLDNDEYVIAVVRPESKNKDKLKKLQTVNIKYRRCLEIIELSLGNLDMLYKDIKIQADCFYHLAWNGSSGKAREDFNIQNTNIAHMGKAVETAKACGCERIVGSGSQAEYGICHDRAYEEKTLLNPFLMYGAAKLAAYQMGRILAEQIGISLVWPRIYSIYGVGENPGTLVNYVMSCLVNKKIPQISSCQNMWNYMYITDCVRALRLLGEDVKADGIYNVASQDTRPLREFVCEIRNITAPEVKLKFDSCRDSLRSMCWLEPDTKKLYNLENMEVKISFRDGIKKKLMEEY